MADDTTIKSGKEDEEQIEFTISEDRIFIKGLWKGKTSKSKKGNLNMSWHHRAVFDEAVNAYLKTRPFYNNPKPKPEESDDDIPF